MNNIMNAGFTSIQQATGSINKKNNLPADMNNTSDKVSFDQILNQQKSIEEVIDGSKSSSIKFSKHAGERLQQREIQLTQEQISRLEEGTQKAGAKGIKESLVLLDNMAFIVNTQNNTVVTAMNSDTNEENIYTNIDGAVII